MDESNKQLKQSKVANIPAKPVRIERIETRYGRNRTGFFLSFEPLAGKRLVKLLKRKA